MPGTFDEQQDIVAQAQQMAGSDAGKIGGGTVSLARNLAGPAAKIAQVAETRQAALEAQTKANLLAAQHGQAMQSLNDQVADHIIGHLGSETVAERHQKMDDVSKQIVLMRKRSKEAKETTGNMVAAQTYDQVAEVLTKRLRSMQQEDVQASTQPAQMEPVTDQVGPGPQPIAPRTPKF